MRSGLPSGRTGFPIVQKHEGRQTDSILADLLHYQEP
jgi:hypothetical protein